MHPDEHTQKDKMSPSGGESGDNLPRPGGHSRSSSDRNIQKPKGAHKRNVSWSHDAPPSTGSVALQQPDLTGEHGGVTGGGAMNGIGGGGGGGPTGPLPPALKPKLQVQRNKTMDSLISNLSPDPRGPGHVRTNTRITLTDLTVSQCVMCYCVVCMRVS